MISVFSKKFQGKKERIVRTSETIQFVVDENQILKWMGTILLNADSWGTGRLDRRTKKTLSEHNNNEQDEN